MGVGRIALTLVDRSRPTPANKGYAGAPDRTLETVVSYPTQGDRPVPDSPLIVFGTGFGRTATSYAPLYDHWVRAGYVVAAPTFPLSREDAPGGTSPVDMLNQPGDLRFVLDHVLTENGRAGSELHGLVDPERVALAGKSMGGITALLAGYDPEQRDPRFRAVIAMTGLAMDTVRGDQFDTPLLLLHGDEDEIIAADRSVDAYERAQRPKYLVLLLGQSHVGPFDGGDGPAARVVHATTVAFLDAYVRDDSGARERLVRDGDVPGVATLRAEP
jgi:predicted dienelactone hydrolase